MIEDLCRALNAQPFQPFRIHMNGGRSFEVRHPEMVLLSRSTVHVGLPPDDEVAEHIEMLHARNITSVEILGEPHEQS
jgi:hypothetical protein